MDYLKSMILISRRDIILFINDIPCINHKIVIEQIMNLFNARKLIKTNFIIIYKSLHWITRINLLINILNINFKIFIIIYYYYMSRKVNTRSNGRLYARRYSK